METSENNFTYPQELVHHEKGHFRVVHGAEEKRKLLAQGWSEDRDPDRKYVVYTSTPEHREAQFAVAAKGMRARIAKARQTEADKSMDQKVRDVAHFEAEKLEQDLVTLLELEQKEKHSGKRLFTSKAPQKEVATTQA